MLLGSCSRKISWSTQSDGSAAACYYANSRVGTHIGSTCHTAMRPPVSDYHLSDHWSVTCRLNLDKPITTRKTKTFRKIKNIHCWRSLDWNRLFRISDQSVICNTFPNLLKRLCSYRRMVRWSPITSILSCSRLIVNTIARRLPCSKSWTMFLWKWNHNTWLCWSFWTLMRHLIRSIIPSCSADQGCWLAG